jgi:hypothetical protein
MLNTGRYTIQCPKKYNTPFSAVYNLRVTLTPHNCMTIGSVFSPLSLRVTRTDNVFTWERTCDDSFSSTITDLTFGLFIIFVTCFPTTLRVTAGDCNHRCRHVDFHSRRQPWKSHFDSFVWQLNIEQGSSIGFELVCTTVLTIIIARKTTPSPYIREWVDRDIIENDRGFCSDFLYRSPKTNLSVSVIFLLSSSNSYTIPRLS